MYNLIPLILIIASLIVIIVIVSRKFSLLANLDVDNIPGEKEAKFKENIAGTRIKRNLVKWNSKFSQVFSGAFQGLNSSLKNWYDKLFQIKENYEQQISAHKESQDEKITRLFREIEELDPEEEFEAIENKLIEIVGLDSKNVNAFEKLGDLYFRNKRLQEAKETYEHILKLIPDEDVAKQADIYYDLAVTAKSRDNWKFALENIQKAFSLAPNNPRYLDIMFEASIMNDDKELATTAYDKLSEVNPENKKLEDFKEQLENLTKSD